jgi:hypothetical protein
LTVGSVEAHIPVGSATAVVKRVSWHKSLGLRRYRSEDAFLRETGAVGAAAVFRFEARASDLYHVTQGEQWLDRATATGDQTKVGKEGQSQGKGVTVPSVFGSSDTQLQSAALVLAVEAGHTCAGCPDNPDVVVRGCNNRERVAAGSAAEERAWPCLLDGRSAGGGSLVAAVTVSNYV